MRTVAIGESRARVAQLKALGYRIKVVTLPSGDRVVLTSKKPFVCSAHHCVLNERGAPAREVPWPKKKANKKKKSR